MNSSKDYFIHQLFFLSIVTVICLLPLPEGPFFFHFEILLSLLLFFGLGIPHGALDLSLAKKLLQPRLGSYWGLLFFLGYLCCVGGIVFCWILFPLASFLFFLMISAFHFGFSDRFIQEGWKGTLEGLARGFLPITFPAYFYPQLFQELVESSLSLDQALVLINIVHFFFFPSLILLGGLILDGFWQRNKTSFMNSLELASLLVLFLSLKPFTAFLVYFCFLHSIRHLLYVLEEMQMPLSYRAIKWLIVQALPATGLTLLALAALYFSFEHEMIDIPLMLNLFFISLAALTFPHMILVETTKREPLRTKSNSLLKLQ